jgi:RNA ligase
MAEMQEDKSRFMKEIIEANKSTAPVIIVPTFINAIATQEEFDAAHKNQEVSRQRHPEYPFSIYKYSQSTTFSKNWNTVTMASRGLIVNDETGEILARPFPKFFNYSEHATPAELMTGPIVVAEKADGSLGILFPTPDGLQISTAGGFQSPQAAHATEVYRERYEGNWKPRSGYTYLYEIVYPENRIVVNNENEDDIILLGAVRIKDGKSLPVSKLKEWKWKRVEEFSDLTSVESVVNAPDRSNHEGYVVHYTDTDTRVKIKHAEYLRHHRFATGINSRRIWEMLRDSSSDMDSWRKNAPEEFEDYINNSTATLQSQFKVQEDAARDSYDKVIKSLPNGYSQKDFAIAVNKDMPSKFKGFAFNFHQDGQINDKQKKTLWDLIKPEHENSIWGLGNGRSSESDS